MVLSSFLPQSGQILSVAVYPSEFGLQRMKEEEVHGPVGLFDDEGEKNGEDSDNDEIDDEKLRAYEKSRLRYFILTLVCKFNILFTYFLLIYLLDQVLLCCGGM